MSSSSFGDVNCVEVFISPWTDQLYSVSAISLKESLGGEMAGGTAKLMAHLRDTDKRFNSILEQRTGKLKIKDTTTDGVFLEVPIFITRKTVFGNHVEIVFICTTKENDSFLTTPRSDGFLGISDALEGYVGKIDSNIGASTQLEGLEINQVAETGFAFCNRLAGGWRPDTVYAFDLNGNLRIRDISKCKVEDKNIPTVALGKTRFYTKPPKLLRTPLLDSEPYNPWEPESKDLEQNLTKKNYSGVQPEQVSSIVYRGDYGICSKSYATLLQNTEHNARYYNSGFFTQAEIKAITMPKYRVGDIVKVSSMTEELLKDGEVNLDLSAKTFLIGSFEIFWTGQGAEGKQDDKQFKFSVTSTIYGLERKDWNNAN